MEPIFYHVPLFYWNAFEFYSFLQWWWGQNCKTKQNHPYLPHHWLETEIIPRFQQVYSWFQSNSLLNFSDFAPCLWWTFVSRKAQRTSTSSYIPSLETPPTQRLFCILRKAIHIDTSITIITINVWICFYSMYCLLFVCMCQLVLPADDGGQGWGLGGWVGGLGEKWVLTVQMCRFYLSVMHCKFLDMLIYIYTFYFLPRILL